MIREILKYPDKRLKQTSKDVEYFDEHLHTLLDDMYETMGENGGIGLAAIQVGIPQNVLIIELYDEEGEKASELFEVINPKIISRDGEIKYKEGCLSIPEFYEEVTRNEHVTVSYKDRDGNEKTVDAHGLLAIALQHEMDHLNGRLFFERLSILKRKKFEKEYKTSVKTGKK